MTHAALSFNAITYGYEFKQPIVIIHHKGIVDDELIVHHATNKTVSIPT